MKKDGVVEKAVEMLEGRLVNLKELPLHLGWLFGEVDLGCEEARGMVEGLDPSLRGSSSLSFSGVWIEADEGYRENLSCDV